MHMRRRWCICMTYAWHIGIFWFIYSVMVCIYGNHRIICRAYACIRVVYHVRCIRASWTMVGTCGTSARMCDRRDSRMWDDWCWGVPSGLGSEVRDCLGSGFSRLSDITYIIGLADSRVLRHRIHHPARQRTLPCLPPVRRRQTRLRHRMNQNRSPEPGQNQTRQTQPQTPTLAEYAPKQVEWLTHLWCADPPHRRTHAHPNQRRRQQRHAHPPRPDPPPVGPIALGRTPSAFPCPAPYCPCAWTLRFDTGTAAVRVCLLPRAPTVLRPLDARLLAHVVLRLRFGSRFRQGG
ncbi:hypothetical protein D2E24_1216 [Bifidobacterium samirii]|uniref:Uncharacterized protein n=1 Tax=Bifidobacterium samirii TaxID=2306974 RepID=A0A430FTJ9_9BIFI|nr:hypothetical protein D2E24_1216 [Bifidobacterium samirii]